MLSSSRPSSSSSSSSSWLISVFISLSSVSLSLARQDHFNLTVSNVSSFADLIDRALQKEFTETEQAQADVGGFNNSVAEQQVI